MSSKPREPHSSAPLPRLRTNRMKLLPGGAPLRPAIVRVEDGGVPIQVEVWSMPRSAVGAFLERIPAPLGLGSWNLPTARG